MKKAMTVLGLGAAAVAISVSNASAMEQAQTTTDINLRQDPSATSNKVSELKAGANLQVQETKDGWTKVQTEDGQNGWVSGYYVSGEDNKETAQTNDADSQAEANQNVQTENTAEANNQTTNNENNAVNNTNTTNTTNNNASTTNNNVNTEANSAQNGSAKEENVDGSKYIKESSKDDNKPAKVTSNGKLNSTAALNVRVGPSVSNGVSSVIYKGEIFKVVEKAPNGWVKVVLNDGTTGWANGKYIDLTEEEDKTNITDYNKKPEQDASKDTSKDDPKVEETVVSQEAAKTNQGKVNSSVGLNVRAGAGTNTSVLTTLKNNSVVNIIGEENGWYKVKLDNGSIGYVGANYITKTSSDSVTNIKESTETTTSNSQVANQGSTEAAKKVVDVAQSLLGVKYSWGGTTTAGFDCSGFTQYVYKNALGINIPRVSRDQAKAGTGVAVNQAKAGDLLYFDTMGNGTTSHVGIYLGEGKFIHASGTASRPEYVKISSLSERWVNCLGARRFA